MAQKIHTIATFRTRKILSITTASGRSVPLDHRPVFGSWMDMDDFQNGEQWKVEWGELDKGLMDKIVSRFVQVCCYRATRRTKEVYIIYLFMKR